MLRSDPDVLIVGAGFTGAMIAHVLAESGHNVVVVEAARVASGSTQLSPGLLLADPADGERGQRNFEQLIVLARARGWTTAEATVALADAGTPDQPRLSAQGTQPGLWCQLHACTLDLLSHPRIFIREGLEISRLESDGHTVSALAEGYTLRARNCVVATGAYTGLLAPETRQQFDVVRCVAWQSRPTHTPIRVNTIDAGLPLCVDQGRMLIAQDSQGSVRIMAQQAVPSVTDPVEDIHRFLRRYLHELYDSTEAWHNGVTIRTSSGLPTVLPLAQFPGVIAALNGGSFAPTRACETAASVLAQLS